MSPVTYLPGAAPRPSCGPADPRVISAIEQLLARARSGEVLAIAVAMVVPHGCQYLGTNGYSITPRRNPEGHQICISVKER